MARGFGKIDKFLSDLKLKTHKDITGKKIVSEKKDENLIEKIFK